MRAPAQVLSRLRAAFRRYLDSVRCFGRCGPRILRTQSRCVRLDGLYLGSVRRFGIISIPCVIGFSRFPRSRLSISTPCGVSATHRTEIRRKLRTQSRSGHLDGRYVGSVRNWERCGLRKLRTQSRSGRLDGRYVGSVPFSFPNPAGHFACSRPPSLLLQRASHAGGLLASPHAHLGRVTPVTYPSSCSYTDARRRKC